MGKTSKKEKARADSNSDSQSDTEEIHSWAGGPIEKAAFLASIISALEDEPEADTLITRGTVIIKDKEYVTSIDHSDNLDEL